MPLLLPPSLAARDPQQACLAVNAWSVTFFGVVLPLCLNYSLELRDRALFYAARRQQRAHVMAAQEAEQQPRQQQQQAQQQEEEELSPLPALAPRRSRAAGEEGPPATVLRLPLGWWLNLYLFSCLAWALVCLVQELHALGPRRLAHLLWRGAAAALPGEPANPTT